VKPDPLPEPTLLRWSAPDEAAERRMRVELAELVAAFDAPRLAAFAADLATDDDHPVRGAVVADDGSSAAREIAHGGRVTARGMRRRPLAFLLPGHGSQYVRMGAQLYGREAVFTSTMDGFFDGYGSDLRDEWLTASPRLPIGAAERGQPLLFAVDYAMSATIAAWGTWPAALVGHSVGEFAAAAVAGVVGVDEAARHLAARTTLYHDAEPGGLLAVAASRDAVVDHLPPGVTIGVANGPRQTMVAGPEAALQQAAKRLRAVGYRPVRADIPVPFHSPAMAGVAEQCAKALREVPLRPPEIPLYSTRTGRPLTADEAVDPEFWAGQLTTPVLFGDALDRLLADGDFLLVEVGPGRALTTVARQHPAVRAGRSAAISALPARPLPPGAERRQLLEVAAAIWLEGHRVATHM
jgi:[acyl-carrier-protein] S-malonyltransferase